MHGGVNALVRMRFSVLVRLTCKVLIIPGKSHASDKRHFCNVQNVCRIASEFLVCACYPHILPSTILLRASYAQLMRGVCCDLAPFATLAENPQESNLLQARWRYVHFCSTRSATQQKTSLCKTTSMNPEVARRGELEG